MIVVDTSVLAYLYLPGEFTAAAEPLPLEFHQIHFNAGVLSSWMRVKRRSTSIGLGTKAR